MLMTAEYSFIQFHFERCKNKRQSMKQRFEKSNNKKTIFTIFRSIGFHFIFHKKNIFRHTVYPKQARITFLPYLSNLIAFFFWSIIFIFHFEWIKNVYILALNHCNHICRWSLIISVLYILIVYECVSDSRATSFLVVVSFVVLVQIE